MAGLPQAYVEIVNAGFTRLTNAVDGDMVVYTDSNSQSIGFGTQQSSNAALRFSRCNMEIGTNVTLSNRVPLHQRLAISMTTPGVQVLNTGMISSGTQAGGTLQGILTGASNFYTFTLSNTQADFRFANSTSNFVALTSNMQILAASNDTVTAPGYTWSNDASTGLYHVVPGVAGFSGGGQPMVTFSNTHMIVTSNVSAEGISMFRNRFLNGDMRVDQKNLGGLYTFNNTAGYALDRWYIVAVGAANNGVITAQRSAIVPPNTGFTNSIVLTTSTVRSSPAGGDNYQFLQILEGNSYSDFMLGTSAAVPFTMSFWIRSSLTGTFGGTMGNHNDTANYAFSFTVSAANTWEYKVITFPPCTIGSWATDNSRGLTVHWDLGAGSGLEMASNSFNVGWSSGGIFSSSSFVKFVRNAGATLYFTGVQLEKGTMATPFEFRSMMMETLLCQRYHYRRWNDTAYDRFGFFVADSSTVAYGQIRLPARLRALPTVSVSSGSDFFGINGTISASSIVNSTHIGLFQATGSGFTAGACAQFGTAGRTAYTMWMSFDAEIY
jgi:hypothetical protein